MVTARSITTVCVVIALVSVALAGVTLTPAGAANGTPGWKFRADLSNTGVYAGSGPPTPNVNWSFTTGGRVFSSPAVANGVVYVGSEDSNLYALNAQTGAKLWEFQTGSTVSSSPAVANGVVYVGSYDNNLYAFGQHATTLTATAAPTTVAVNKPFSISGTLTTTDGTPIAGATIQLQKNVSGTWPNVTGKTNTTTATGAYRIGTSEPTANTYLYRATYAGNDTYTGSNSTSVSVRVVSKASVLHDLATLRTTVNNLPDSAFIPGTKTALLSLLSATELQVKYNLYGSAATTLQKAVLPRMDGCAKTGKPDSNDWVRTCSAQGLLYPQVQNLIQELQALQGS